jgi:hypothetical protein
VWNFAKIWKIKKKEGIFYGIFPFKLKKIIKFREFVFHHICTSTCNWNVSGFYWVVLWFKPVVKPVAI